jgi:hypothetical protein
MMPIRIFIQPLNVLIALAALAGFAGCAGTEEATAVKKNLSEAEITIDRFETAGSLYVLRGRVVSATPVGGAESIVEPGQEIFLTPYFPGDRPDPANPTHSRLISLPKVPPGSTIRCRITLDAVGAWRIVSVD